MTTAAGGSDGAERLSRITAAHAAPFVGTAAFTVTSIERHGCQEPCRTAFTRGDHKRLRVVQHETADTPGDAFQRLCRQRLLAIKNAVAGDGPVDAFGGAAPALLSARRLFEMRWLRPDNRQAVTPRDEKEALARGRCAVIGGAEQFPLHTVTECLQGVEETPPAPACPFGIGNEVLLA